MAVPETLAGDCGTMDDLGFKKGGEGFVIIKTSDMIVGK
jgi:molybdopterin-binding protein